MSTNATDTRNWTPELLASLETMVDYLLESHADELETCHAGDAELAGEAPEACSYCREIADARAVIAKAKGGRT